MIFTRRHVLIIAGLVLFLAGIAIFVFFPSLNGLTQTRKTTAEWSDEISERYIKGSSLEKGLREFEENEDTAKELAEIVFITEENNFDFIKFLQSLSDRQIEQRIFFDINNKIRQGDTITVPIKIETESSLRRFIQYLQDLESSRFYIRITSLNMERSQDLSQVTPAVQTIIQGFVYSKDEEYAEEATTTGG